MPTLVDTLYMNNEYVEIWQYGPNDFAVYYKTLDASCRGTLLQVMKDLHNCFGVFAD